MKYMAPLIAIIGSAAAFVPSSVQKVRHLLFVVIEVVLVR